MERPPTPKSLNPKDIKKTLDKVDDEWYNIRKDTGVALPSYANSASSRAVIKEDLLKAGGFLQVMKSEISILPKPVIAGGICRDFYYGLYPKDVDVFLPCNDIEHAYEVLDEVSLYFMDTTYHDGYEFVAQIKQEGKGYKSNMGERAIDLFNVQPPPEDALQQAARHWGEPRERENKPTKLQIIVGLYDDRPVETTFDLSTSMAAYDIDTQSILFRKAFLQSAMKKAVDIFPENTHDPDYTESRKHNICNRLGWAYSKPMD